MNKSLKNIIRQDRQQKKHCLFFNNNSSTTYLTDKIKNAPVYRGIMLANKLKCH